jgi:hypothetical protein
MKIVHWHTRNDQTIRAINIFIFSKLIMTNQTTLHMLIFASILVVKNMVKVGHMNSTQNYN